MSVSTPQSSKPIRKTWTTTTSLGGNSSTSLSMMYNDDSTEQSSSRASPSPLAGRRYISAGKPPPSPGQTPSTDEWDPETPRRTLRKRQSGKSRLSKYHNTNNQSTSIVASAREKLKEFRPVPRPAQAMAQYFQQQKQRFRESQATTTTSALHRRTSSSSSLEGDDLLERGQQTRTYSGSSSRSRNYSHDHTVLSNGSSSRRQRSHEWSSAVMSLLKLDWTKFSSPDQQFQALVYLLLFMIACFLIGSHRMVVQATEDIQGLTENESRFMRHLSVMEQHSVDFANALQELQDRAPSRPLSQQQPLSSNQLPNIDLDLIQEQISKLHDMEHDLEHQLSGLSHYLQDSARHSLRQAFGTIDHLKLSLQFQASNDISIMHTLSVQLSATSAPNAVWSFVQQLDEWKGAYLTPGPQGRMFYITPHEVAVDNPSDRDLHSSLKPPMEIEEHSDWAHRRNSLSWTTDGLVLNLQDNVRYFENQVAGSLGILEEPKELGALIRMTRGLPDGARMELAQAKVLVGKK